MAFNDKLNFDLTMELIEGDIKDSKRRKKVIRNNLPPKAVKYKYKGSLVERYLREQENEIDEEGY